MKIVCDSCSTKYSIADEKVKGKVFKIRCKKCSHIIVVKGGGEAQAAEGKPAGASFDQKETRVFDYSGFDGGQAPGGAAPPPGAEAAPDPAADAGSDAVWHLVIDREQVGPMTIAEVGDRFKRGEIDADTYGWREGFADWLKLSAIPDFSAFAGAANGHADSGGPPESTSPTGKSDPADLFAAAAASEAADDGGGDLFGGAGASSGGGGLFGAVDRPAAAKPKGRDDDLFASAGASGGGGDLFGEAGGAASPSASAQASMKGQRNENSVLFSLNNLAALASGPAKSSSSPSPSSSSQSMASSNAQPGYASSSAGGEGSGLIDIRAMAATTLGTSRPAAGGLSSSPADDLPVLSSSPFSVGASPILVPISPQGSTPKWLMPALIGLGALLLIVAGTLIFLLTRSSNKKNDTVASNDKGGVTAPGNNIPPGNGVNPPGAGLTPPGAGTTNPPGAGTTNPPTAAGGTDPGTAGGTPAGNPPTPDKPTTGGDVAVKPDHPTKPDKGHPTKPDKPGKIDVKPGKVDPKPIDEPKPPKGGDKPMSKGDMEIKCMVNPDLPICKKPHGGGDAEPVKKPVVDADLPAQLGKPEIQAGIGAIKGNATGCYEKYKVPGTVTIHLTISPGGGVAGASATGTFSGTPTGSCVESAVKHAHFKKFSGPAMSVNYPFVLR